MAVESRSRGSVGGGDVRRRSRRRSLLATVVSLAAVAAGTFTVAMASPAGAVPSSPTGCGTMRAEGDQSITVDGATVSIYLPKGDHKGKLPLVLDLHGSGTTGEQTLNSDGIRAVADREGFAVAAPNGAVPFAPAPGFSGFAWNIPGVPLVGTTIYPPAGTRDDVQFVSHVIDGMQATTCVDAKRVYATGVSGGGRMASQLACDLSDRIAAIAPVSGVRFPQASDNPGTSVTCAPGRAVPVIAIHGVWDPVNVFAATPPPEAASLPAKINPPVPGSSWSYSAQEAVLRWTLFDRCTGPTRVTSETPNIDRITYTGCRGGSEVQLYKVKNSGHALPGHGNPALDFLLNPTNNEVDGTQVAWDFLSRFRL